MDKQKRIRLTAEDVERLLAEDRSIDSQLDIGDKVFGAFATDELHGDSEKIAEEIIWIFTKSVLPELRKKVSASLKDCPKLDPEVARTLARDIEEVALPIIEFSEVLSEEDLLEIIGSDSEQKQVAVARRKHISERVSEALVETNNEMVVETLVNNETAKISENSFTKIVTRFKGKPKIEEGVAFRKDLPITVAEKLVTFASAKIQEHLVSNFDFPPDLASDIILQTREKATIGLLKNSSDADVRRLVDQLYRNGRLTPSIILRAVCTGDMTFFEASISRLAGVPMANARVLIHDAGPLGLKSLYEKAKLPPNLFRAFRVAIDVYHNTEYDGEDNDQQRFMRTMIERILTQVDDIDADDLEYLMGKLSQIADFDMASAMN